MFQIQKLQSRLTDQFLGFKPKNGFGRLVRGGYEAETIQRDNTSRNVLQNCPNIMILGLHHLILILQLPIHMGQAGPALLQILSHAVEGLHQQTQFITGIIGQANRKITFGNTLRQVLMACTGALISRASLKANQVAPKKMTMVMSPNTKYNVNFRGYLRERNSRDIRSNPV